MSKFDKSRLAMFENMGKKTEEKAPPQPQSPAPSTGGGKFNSDRLAFVQKLRTQTPTTRPGAHSVSKTKSESSDSSPHKEDDQITKSESGSKSPVDERESSPDHSGTEANKEKENETGKENGKAVVVVRMASVKKDGYVSKLNGGANAPPAAPPSGGDTGTSAPAPKRGLAAARGLNINLGALRPGATFISKRKSEGINSDMSALVLDRPSVQSGRRRKSRLHNRSTSIDDMDGDESLAMGGKVGKRWSVMGPSSTGGMSDDEVMTKESSRKNEATERSPPNTMNKSEDDIKPQGRGREKDKKSTIHDSDEDKQDENEAEIDEFMLLLDRKESIDQRSKSVPPQETTHSTFHPKEETTRLHRMLSPELRSMVTTKQKLPAIQPLDSSDNNASDPSSDYAATLASREQQETETHANDNGDNSDDHHSSINEKTQRKANTFDETISDRSKPAEKPRKSTDYTSTSVYANSNVNPDPNPNSNSNSNSNTNSNVNSDSIPNVDVNSDVNRNPNSDSNTNHSFNPQDAVVKTQPTETAVVNNNVGDVQSSSNVKPISTQPRRATLTSNGATSSTVIRLTQSETKEAGVDSEDDPNTLREQITEMEHLLEDKKRRLADQQKNLINQKLENMKPLLLMKKLNEFSAQANMSELEVLRKILVNASAKE